MSAAELWTLAGWWVALAALGLVVVAAAVAGTELLVAAVAKLEARRRPAAELDQAEPVELSELAPKLVAAGGAR